jgi:hypothetical protein
VIYKVLILPAAQQDIKEAALWYNEMKKGLGLRFSKNVRLNLKYIIKNPLLFMTCSAGFLILRLLSIIKILFFSFI